MSGRPLAGVRVVDFTWVRAGPWGTRLLAALGAEVIKVEWPQPGLPHYRQRMGESWLPHGVPPGLNRNPYWSETHAGKRSVTVNMRTPAGLALVKRLLRTSDVVIENFSAGIMESWGLGYEQMKAEKPDIVYVSMAGLGHAGRNSHYKTDGPIVQPLSGLTQLSGLPGEPPARWLWAYMDDTGGMYAVICALAGLHQRTRTGHGLRADLSQVAAAMTLTGTAWLDYTVNRRPWRRDGFPTGNRTHWPGTPLHDLSYRGPATAPHNSYRTYSKPDEPHPDNAWCAIACFSDEEWRRLVEVMGSPDWAVDSKYATIDGRLAHQDELDRQIEAWTIELDKYEVMRRCQAAGVPAMPIQDASDRVERDPQLEARGTLQVLPHPDIGPYRYQTLPFTGSAMDLMLQSAGPRAGSYNVPILNGLLGVTLAEIRRGYEDGTFWPKGIPLEPYLLEALDEAERANGHAIEANGRAIAGNGQYDVSTGHASVRTAPDSADTAFGDLRVLELGGLRAQWAAKLLGDLGADVVKIEPPGGSPERQVGPFVQDEPHPDRSLSFWHANTSKRSVTLDLEAEEGRAALMRLAETADVLIEGFAPGYLASIGLSYDVLRQVNPRLIVCSVTPFGQNGPWRDFAASDLMHMAAGGFMALCGYLNQVNADAPPIAPTGGQSWMTGGHAAMIAIGSALYQREQTGLGQHLDVSVHEACSLVTETHLPRYLARDEVHYRGWDRRQEPQWEYFRCRDGIYLSVHWVRFVTPEHIISLACWMDEYGLADDLLDGGYDDPEVMAANTAHVEQLMIRFFATLDGEEAFRGLQERGFVAGISRAAEEIVHDPHWTDRGFPVPVEHPELGRTLTYPGAYAILDEAPWAIRRRPPTIGEHTAEVLAELTTPPSPQPAEAGAR